MKQVLQNLSKGKTEITDTPIPSVSDGSLLIRTTRTLLSPGTERMLIEFSNANLVDKARQQPDKVREVLDKIKTDGLFPTVEKVFNKLNQPLPLGYCNTGIVGSVGNSVTGFLVGDRVVSNGNHAEVVNVPMNLCAKIPDNVSDDEAVFTIIGAIALQGIRLIKPTLGETVVVTGLGLVGLMAAQLLKANGCRVIGIDVDSDKLELANKFCSKTVNISNGEDPLIVAKQFSRERGVDAVLITASTKSNEPVHQAANMCRKRGRIVLVGVTGLELSRADFYEKELTFQVSCSYGPGRYDSAYEDKGQDYPFGFVRWTEQRNMEAILDMIADGRIDVSSLISHKFLFSDAEKAYELLGQSNSSLGILLEYPGICITNKAKTLTLKSPSLGKRDQVSVSFIGAGNYAAQVLAPCFLKAGVRLKTIATSGGLGGALTGRKFGFEKTTTDTDIIFEDEETNAVIIATRHDSHAKLVLKALQSGKHVFVEKPLCITRDEFNNIKQEINGSDLCLMVGFNRRFAPQIKKVKSLLSTLTGSKSYIITINSGAIPTSHWTQDSKIGGGRIIGEVCHFIDILRGLAECPIVDYNKMVMEDSSNDTVCIQLRFEDGSIGAIHYFSNGNKSYPKERLEVFAEGRVLKLDNFRKLEGYGWPSFRKMNLWKQDKGQNECVQEFIEAISSGSSFPIPINEILEVSELVLDIALEDK